LFIERKIADRGEIIEIREFLEPCFNVGLGLPQLLILQLQLDPMDLKFLQKPLRVGSFFNSRPFFRLLAQPRFSKAAQLADTRGGVGLLFYFPSSPSAPGAFRIVSPLGLERGTLAS
jgi:hypothetical protein